MMIRGSSIITITISMSSLVYFLGSINSLPNTLAYIDIFGSESRNILADNDVLVGGPGHDVFDCGEGIDRVVDFDPNEDTASSNCELLG